MPPGRPKTNLGLVLGAQLGAMLATFSAQGGPRSPRTPPKGVPGDVLARLGGVLGRLGGVLGRLLLALGPQEAPKES